MQIREFIVGLLPKFVCPHDHEVLSRRRDGRLGLLCPDCGHSRPHPWGQTAKEAQRWAKKRSGQSSPVIEFRVEKRK